MLIVCDVPKPLIPFIVGSPLSEVATLFYLHICKCILTQSPSFGMLKAVEYAGFPMNRLKPCGQKNVGKRSSTIHGKRLD